MTQIPKIVERLLRKQAISHPPVPVHQIAKSLGIVVEEAAAPDDVSGALVRSQDGIVIAVNSEQHPNRQRFTIAHELGHFLLHEGKPVHVDHDFLVNLRNSRSSQALDWQEIEANQFAAELLMPGSFLRRDIEKDGSDLDTARLARRYKVSQAAMSYRLVNLGVILETDFIS